MLDRENVKKGALGTCPAAITSDKSDHKDDAQGKERQNRDHADDDNHALFCVSVLAVTITVAAIQGEHERFQSVL